MGGHTIARRYGEGLSFTNLHFKKKGSAIKKAIGDRIRSLDQEIFEAETDIKKICKLREVDAKEILEAGEDERKIEAYTIKMSNNVPMQSRSVLELLQKDLNTLKMKASLVVRRRVLIDELRRVSKNLESGRSFDLTFDEICDLGF